MRPRKHRSREIALRPHVEKGTEVEQVKEVLELQLLPSGYRFIRRRRHLAALDGEVELLLEGDAELRVELLELIDGRHDVGLGAEDLLLLLVEGFALYEGLFHLEDAVVFLAEGAEALVHEAEDRPVGRVRGRRGRH